MPEQRPPERIQAALDAGADIESKTHDGTALQRLAIKGNISSQDTFWKNGADVNVADDRNGTPLHWTAILGNVEMVELFLKYDAETEARHGFSSRHSDLIVSKVPSRRSQNEYSGSTALHLAAWHGQLLVQAGEYTEVANDKGNTPLQLAERFAEENPVGSKLKDLSKR